MYVLLVKGLSGKWHVRIMADNNRIVLPSENYSRKWNAKPAAKQLAKIFKLKWHEA